MIPTIRNASAAVPIQDMNMSAIFRLTPFAMTTPAVLCRLAESLAAVNRGIGITHQVAAYKAVTFAASSGIPTNLVLTTGLPARLTRRQKNA